MNRLLTLLLPLALAAAAQAQAPHALNAPPLPSADADRLLVPEVLLGARGAPPDTTSPWRYYPLQIGNAWEYYEFRDDAILRREINRDTTFNGHRYFIQERYRALAGGPLEPDIPALIRIRFDTTSALVYEPFLDGSGRERVPFYVPCPFDADFDTFVEWPAGKELTPVTGGHNGILVFDDDTLEVTWKQYNTGPPRIYRYAADFGEAYVESDVELYGLSYARVDGVEYGVPRYPVAAEPSPESEADVALLVWPNPARGQVRVAFTPEEAQTMRLEVHDALGRRVRAHEVRARPGLQAEAVLDLSGLAPGRYVVRVVGQTHLSSVLLTVFE